MPDDRRGTTNGRVANLRRVLRDVASSSALSRADLARATGLTRPTVSSLVAELMDAGLIVELGPGRSDGGKPPTLLGVDPTARSVVAIDVGPPAVVGTLSDLAGTVLARESIPDPRLTGAELLDAVVALADDLAGRSTAPVAGIGVGTAGLVTPDGVVVEASNLDWHHLPLAQILTERTGHPAWVANGANAAALAEHRSVAPEGDGLVVVRMGVGVGAGLLIGGQVHAGSRAAAGEIGHLVVDPGGPPCRCGNRGCLETLTSVTAILGRAAELAGVEDDPDLPRDLGVLRERLGDDAVATALREAGTSLGVVLANLVATVDVTHIVLSPELEGDVSDLTDAVREAMRERLLPGHADGVDLRVSTLGPDLVLHGAHALVLSGALGLVGIGTPDGEEPVAEGELTP